MRARFTGFVVAVAAGLALAAPAWAQDPVQDGTGAGPVDFRVAPAPDAATSPRGGWFVLDLEPGGEIRQGLTVHNQGDEPIDLALAAVDADTGPIGGASYRRLDAPVEATGAWIALERQQVRLDPGQTETIALTVRVPADAQSGDHLAGIAVWAPGDLTETQDTPGAVVAIEQRRIVAVHVTLPGPAEPLLRISGVEPQAHAGGVRLRVRIANEGHGLTSGEGVLEVVDPAFDHAVEFGTFVPRTAIAYPVAWADERPAEGTYQARVRLEYDGSTETWEGTFTIGEDISRELEQFEVEGDDRFANPWWWLVAGAAAMLVLALIGWVIYVLARRHRRPVVDDATVLAGGPAAAAPARGEPAGTPSATHPSQEQPASGPPSSRRSEPERLDTAMFTAHGSHRRRSLRRRRRRR